MIQGPEFSQPAGIPMRLFMFMSLGVLCAACAAPTVEESVAEDVGGAFVRENDLIYYKQRGVALTMDRVAPTREANGAAVMLVLSGGWFSSHDNAAPHELDQMPAIFAPQARELLDRGYTLFYVVHAAQPKFTIREIDEQLETAVRHIRFHAEQYGFDAGRIGIMGGSAGGHLSLMRGTRGEDGVGQAASPSEVSSRVQAVVAYFPPTDFLNYGGTGVFFDQVVRQVIPGGKNPFLQAFDYLEFDPVETRLNKVTDEKRLAEHYRYIAPAYHVTSDDAPTLLLHGNVDRLVPLQQSRLMVEHFTRVDVAHELYVKDGGDHGWEATEEEVRLIGDWFDRHL